MLRKLGFFFALPFLFYVATALPAFADCPTGAHPATQADLADMTAAGIPSPTVGKCWNPNDTNVGGDAGAAKEFLLTRYTPGSCSQQYVSRADGINKLDSQFAIKLAEMLKAAPMVININSAYRSPQAQQCANPKVTNSNHIKGCAVDLQWDQGSCSSAACQWVLANASKYSLNIPMHYSPEWNHLQPINVGNCKLGAGDTSTSAAPPFNNQVRSALGMQPAPPPPPAPQPPVQSSGPLPPPVTNPATALPPAIGTLNSTPYAPGTCNPQTYCSQSDGNIYSRATTCVDQIYQQCSAGCAGVVCNATSTNSALGNLLTPAATVTNDNSNTNTNLTGTSSFDLIDFFANGPSITGVNVGTATPIDINESIQDGGDISTLAPSSTSGGIIQTPPQGTTGGLYVASQQQTFTSSDLSGSGGASYGFAQNTFTQQVLAQMKAALLAALPYVQPFGGIQTFSE